MPGWIGWKWARPCRSRVRPGGLTACRERRDDGRCRSVLSYNAQMRNRTSTLALLALTTFAAQPLAGQQAPPAGQAAPAPPRSAIPRLTEVWEPVPPVVTPGATNAAPPSDAIVLFDGKNLDQWVATKDKSPAKWTVADGVLTVKKTAGNIETKRSFKNYQLHLEWRVPADITGTGQARGNSGLFLASTGAGDAGYELQILDSYKNETYVNGQAAASTSSRPRW